MEFLHFRRNHARQVLLRLILLTAVAIALIIWKSAFLKEIYLGNQLTQTGLLINGGIVLLFLLGMAKMIGTLIAYAREENALLHFVENLQLERKNPLNSVPKQSIIAHRYQLMRTLHERRVPVEHGTLAATLVATESTRTSLPKFINNVLILTGVFGTIVSLSIALVGASNLLESVVDAKGMGLVIHGMSTALSTTITAILCYMFFGYFYLKLTDTQTNLLSAVEQVTASLLIPRFHIDTDSALYEFSGLIRSLQGLVTQMGQSQDSFAAAQESMGQLLASHQQSFEGVSSGVHDIRALLREGFRLPEPS